MARTDARPLVTVITPTRGRPEAVRAAIMSVCSQTLPDVEHLVFGDDCPDLAQPDVLDALRRDFPVVRIANVPSGPSALAYRPARTARIRNLGICRARGTFIAHLDDDNTFEPDHLATLVACLRANPAAIAAHSWRQLFTRKGGPFIPGPLNPWIADPTESAANYADLADSGVFQAGSNIMRDCVTGCAGQKFFLVDVSELLVRADFHRAHLFPTEYSAPEISRGLCEDRAWCITVVQAGYQIAQSRRATLRYFMGGYSNGRAATEDGR
jgi:glycosyltransferase involved in cell wall biosynthesis